MRVMERLRQPYPNSVSALLLTLIVPSYHVIAGIVIAYGAYLVFLRG